MNISEKYELLKTERSDYASKAKSLGFKPSVPKMPERNKESGLLGSTMVGFVKRFSNWKLSFSKFENNKTEE